MFLGDMMVLICGYYGNKYSVDSVRATSIIHWLEGFESVNVKDLYKHILEKFEYFPTIAGLTKYIKSESFYNANASDSLKNIQKGKDGLYVSKENLEKYKYSNKSKITEQKDLLSFRTTIHFERYLENGIITDTMKTNLFLMSLLRDDEVVHQKKIKPKKGQNVITG